MKTRTLTMALASALMLAAVTPLTTAHLSATGSYTSGLLSTGSGSGGPDWCRWEGSGASLDELGATVEYLEDWLDSSQFDAGCIGSDGVSGTYVISPANVFITGGDIFPLTVTSVGTVFPQGFQALSIVYCDGEIALNELLYEERVDEGSSNQAQLIPDGTLDDGGVGGACHSTADSFGASSLGEAQASGNPAQHEDPPTQPRGRSGGGCSSPTHAVAEDLVSGGDVWIAASCDAVTVAGDGFTLASCFVNISLTSADFADYLDCINEFLSTSPTSPQLICGSDGFGDIINYGPGGASGSPVGVPFGDGGCIGGIAAVFPFNYVSLGGNPCHPNCGIQVIPATAGWIDGRNLSDYTATFGPGITI